MRRPPLPTRLPRPPLRATAAFLCVLGVLGAMWLWLRDSSLVAVRSVTVTGVSGPDAGRVREALSDAARDMTTLHVKTGELRTAVDPYPTVLGVSTHADFPHGLRIAVHERNPIGAVVAGTQRVPVAADGTLMRTTSSADLPEISAKALPGGSHASDPDVRHAVAVLSAAPPALRARVRRVYVGERGWTLPLRNGPVLYLGGSERLGGEVGGHRRRARRPDLDRRHLPRRAPPRAAGGGRPRAPSGPGRAGAGDGQPGQTTAPGATQTTPTPVGP